tara:strand:- start:14490 stop:15098 length:609 start_codon:yes stop_codon:yes gene_type:complete
MNPYIRLSNYSFFFKEKRIFENINFTLYQKDRIGICGINGSGKSTFLRILSSIYDNNLISSNLNICPILSSGVGLLDSLTVIENIKRLSYLMNVKFIDEKKLNEILLKFELNDKQDTKVYYLSSGYKIRIFYVIFFITNFDIIFLDEFVNLGDHKFQTIIKDKFTSKLKTTTLVMASHDISLLRKFCTKIYVIKNFNLELLQ